MQLIVSSNCQTGGIAAALKEIAPSEEVAAVPLPGHMSESETALVEKLKTADVWISAGQWDLLDRHAIRDHNPRLRLLKIPVIGFAAFHPDLYYARRRSDDAYTPYHYNSAIGVWCYQHKLPVEKAAQLFNEASYRALGYLDGWAASVKHLKALFAITDLKDDFDRFLLRVKRSGNFMHSVNHPRAEVLAHLGRIIALRLGAGARVLDMEFEVDDGLGQNVWPMYPEIAASLSLPSHGYRWRIHDIIRLNTVADYLTYAYNGYVEQGIGPEDLYIVNGNDTLLDSVLGPQGGV